MEQETAHRSASAGNPPIYTPHSLAGTTILHYKVIEKLGQGGMGLVYKARDLRLDRFVALKVLPAGMMADPEHKRRFVQEARAASALNHPNIITIHDVVNDNGIDLIVMEYVSGQTLGKLIGPKGLPLKDALTYAVQIADALAKAHFAGIIHRDLKPSNIMVTDTGLVKVLDFGLAKMVDQAQRGESRTAEPIGLEKTLTLEHKIAGTPAYMSPEQAGGRSVDARSDIFSFGVVLYEMITGARAFHGHDQLSILASLARDEPEKITTFAPLTPIELERAMLRALRKDPERRWQSMADLKMALTEVPAAPVSGHKQALEMASILFIDIVSFSLELMDRQNQLITTLQNIVRGTEPFRTATSQGDLVSLPTGDGIALVFFHDPVAPVRCALEIARAAKQTAGLNLRMGLHNGPVYRHADINDELNVVGSGINTAQRVMDAGDTGHILVSSGLADVLGQVGPWRQHLADFGEQSVKHGAVLHFYNLCTGDAGNPARPAKWERPDLERFPRNPGEGKNVAPAAWGARPRINRRQAGTALAAIVASAGAAELYHYTKGPRVFDSVAVLPFASSGSDPEVEYLGDGITENLINALSQVGNLSVRSRSSVLRYKAHPMEPQAAGQKLQVQAVLTGSISQRNGELSISAELVDTRDNRQIWGQRYNRKAEDLLAVQREISQEIAQKLRTRLSGEDEKKLAKRYTENAEAYQLYLKGRYYWYKRTQAELRKAAEHFGQAIKQDPNFALAYAGLADTYSLQSGAIPPTEIFPKAKQAALKAIMLDSNLSEGYAALAFISFLFDWNWAEAEKAYRRAIDLNPNNPLAHSYYARYLCAMQRFNEAITEIDQALRLDPLSLALSTSRGVAFYQARQYDRAIEQQRRTLEMESGYPAARANLAEAYVQKGKFKEAIPEFEASLKLGGDNNGFLSELGQTYALAGRTAEARNVLERLQTLSRQRYVLPTFIAMLHGALGEKDEAFQYLNRGYAERCRPMAFLKVDPLWDPLRSDPRFSELLKRVGL
jgi:serine/threonine protein kinase/TolB-like protein